jgi:hypothetical protein
MRIFFNGLLKLFFKGSAASGASLSLDISQRGITYER